MALEVMAVRSNEVELLLDTSSAKTNMFLHHLPVTKLRENNTCFSHTFTIKGSFSVAGIFLLCSSLTFWFSTFANELL